MKLVVFLLLILLLTIGSALVACTGANTQISTNSRTINLNTTQTTIIKQQNLVDSINASDQDILDQIYLIIRNMGLDVEQDYDFTARVKEGVVTLDGTLLYPNESSLLLLVGNIPGVVRIICNFELIAE